MDVALTVAFCLAQVWIVPADALQSASWVAVVASMTLVCGHLAWHPGVAVPAGVRRTHWSIPDPATNYAAYHHTAANINTRIRHLVPVLTEKEVQP